MWINLHYLCLGYRNQSSIIVRGQASQRHIISTLFMKQTVIKPDSQSLYQRQQAELVSFVGSVDHKIKEVCQRNEEELLGAYELHFERVKKQMDYLRAQQDAQRDGAASQLQEIDFLKKEVALFRKESLDLFKKLTDREKTILELKDQIAQLLSQNGHMQQRMKTLLRRNKVLEAEKETDREVFHITEPEKNVSIIPATYNLNLESVKKPKADMFRYDKPRTGRASTALGSRRSTSKASNTLQVARSIEVSKQNYSKVKQILLDRFPLLDRELTTKIARVIEQSGLGEVSVESARQKVKTDPKWARVSRKSMPQDSQSFTLFNKDTQGSDPQLKDLLLRSVESVRKDIARRRRVNSQNFFKHTTPITLDQFKSMDFIRVMQLVLSSQSMLQTLHRSLLPS